MADLFRTRDFVPDFDRYVSTYRERSALARERLRCRLDVSYGTAEKARLDLYFPEASGGPSPIHMFIHGGYWRMFDKADFGYLAEAITGAGHIAAIINYSLMPSVRMQTIVDEVFAAASWLIENAADYGGDAGRFTVSGHSAGAQLAALLLGTRSPVRPSGALLLSGIYELAPLQESFLKNEIALSDDEVARFSPLRLALEAPERLSILVGENETAPFHEQAKALDRQLRHGTSNCFAQVPGSNHMSVVLDMADPETVCGQHLQDILGA